MAHGAAARHRRSSVHRRPIADSRTFRSGRLAIARHRTPRSLDDLVGLVRSDCGMVRPRAFAVLRLTIVVNTLGSSIGRSVGRVPSRILTTYPAARAAITGIDGPIARSAPSRA